MKRILSSITKYNILEQLERIRVISIRPYKKFK